MKIATYVKSALAASTLLLAATTLPVTAYADTAFYQVRNVQSDDALNIRSGAGVSYPVIGTIPHNGRTVMSTGQTQKNGRTTWAEVVWLGQIGWVNKRYLADSSQVQQQQRTQQAARTNTRVQRNARNTRTNARAQRNARNTRVQRSANTHSHPANRCTRSVTHTHPNGAVPHKHHYSCDPNRNRNKAPAPAVKSNYRAKLPAPVPAVKNNYQANVPTDVNLHKHPSNKCTNSVTHTHPNGARAHQHRYSCKKNAVPSQQYQAQPKYRPQPKYNGTNDYYAIQ